MAALHTYLARGFPQYTLAWIGSGELYEFTFMPFLYRDYEHMCRALTVDFFQPVQKQVEEKTNIKIVTVRNTAPTVCTPTAAGMFTAEEARSRKRKKVSGLTSWSALLMNQDLCPCVGQGLTPRGY